MLVDIGAKYRDDPNAPTSNIIAPVKRD